LFLSTFRAEFGITINERSAVLAIFVVFIYGFIAGDARRLGGIVFYISYDIRIRFFIKFARNGTHVFLVGMIRKAKLDIAFFKNPNSETAA